MRMLVFSFPISHIVFPFFHNFMSLFTLLTAIISWERTPRGLQTGFTPSARNSVSWLILLSYRTPSPSPGPHLIRAPHNSLLLLLPAEEQAITGGIQAPFLISALFLSSPRPVYCEPSRLEWVTSDFVVVAVIFLLKKQQNKIVCVLMIRFLNIYITIFIYDK